MLILSFNIAILGAGLAIGIIGTYLIVSILELFVHFHIDDDSGHPLLNPELHQRF